jgi:hypothetical protein
VSPCRHRSTTSLPRLSNQQVTGRAHHRVFALRFGTTTKRRRFTLHANECTESGRTCNNDHKLILSCARYHRLSCPAGRSTTEPDLDQTPTSVPDDDLNAGPVREPHRSEARVRSARDRLLRRSRSALAANREDEDHREALGKEITSFVPGVELLPGLEEAKHPPCPASQTNWPPRTTPVTSSEPVLASIFDTQSQACGLTAASEDPRGRPPCRRQVGRHTQQARDAVR